MAYTTTTLAQFISYIGSLMGDSGNVYWTPQEITYATWEGLRVWGSLTNYYRSRVTFNEKQSFLFYDLTQANPPVRTRNYTLWQLVQEIQFMLLELPSPNGTISGAQMSQQITIDVILNGIQQARDRFVLDAKLPITVHDDFTAPTPGVGLLSYPQGTVYIHKLYWKDVPSGVWTMVRREDAWSIDRTLPFWTLDPGIPGVYSESELSPLMLQLVPIPINDGKMEVLTVDSLQLNTSVPTTTFNIPDEWIYAVKYAALNYILSAEGQIKDEKRAEYAEQRYQQAIEFAKRASPIIRVMWNNIPVATDTLTALDLANPYWRNQAGSPQAAGYVYDILAFNPGLVNFSTGISVDVVQPAPLPASTDFIQIGSEDLVHLTEYVTHILKFKCGGGEFLGSMPVYDSFMKAVSGRKAINAAKIFYLEPLFGVVGREHGMTPDRLETQNA